MGCGQFVTCNYVLQVPIECPHAMKLDGRVDKMFLPVVRVFRHPSTLNMRQQPPDEKLDQCRDES